jgi:type II secretory pathway component PulK
MRRWVEMNDNSRGTALLFALGILLVFALLGTAWVRYMTLEADEVKLNLNGTRSRAAARGGVFAAVASLDRTVGGAAAAAGQDSLAVPVYRYNAQDNTAPLSPAESLVKQVNLEWTDESAKVNLNEAPTRVLQRILNVDGDTARQIRSSLPRGGEDEMNAGRERRPLRGVEDLRPFLTGEQYANVDPAQVTVFGAERNRLYVNLNQASPAVLAAVLDLDIETAEYVASARPFNGPDDVVAATGKSPELFNVRPSSNGGGDWPEELGFAPRCFRIHSEGVLQRVGGPETAFGLATTRVEAVVAFPANEQPVICYWSEAP